jgi:hypothetical protein
MEGKPNPPENRLLPNAFQHIYDHVTLANTNQREKYLIRASYFKIYNEEIHDLLVSSSQKKNTYSQNLELKELPDLGVYIKDLTSLIGCHDEYERKFLPLGSGEYQFVPLGTWQHHFSTCGRKVATHSLFQAYPYPPRFLGRKYQDSHVR